MQDRSTSSESIFREKSLNHVTAWKYSHAYIKGSGPTVWMAVVAIMIIVIAVMVFAVLVSPLYLVSILTNGAIS